MSEIQAKAEKSLIPAVMNETDLRSLVYVIRGQQVMLDSDLAALYQVETKVFNQAVSRNIERFPENFRFQLTAEEYVALRSQLVTSNGRGGRRYLPYAFTEQGIAMLSGVLRSDVAVQMSIRIMNTFVEMRRFIANNALLFERISNIELKQLEYQKSTDERFDKVFQYIDDHAESQQKIFFDGHCFRGPIYGSRRTEYNALASILVHQLTQVQRTCDIVLVIPQRLSHRLSYRFQSGKMNDCIQFILFKNRPHTFFIQHICFVKLDLFTCNAFNLVHYFYF